MTSPREGRALLPLPVLAEAGRRLVAWAEAALAPFPWRGETDPYRVWVSEVMLQQTRRETVGPYYRRFLERFPDVAALAAATGLPMAVLDRRIVGILAQEGGIGELFHRL